MHIKKVLLSLQIVIRGNDIIKDIQSNRYNSINPFKKPLISKRIFLLYKVYNMRIKQTKLEKKQDKLIKKFIKSRKPKVNKKRIKKKKVPKKKKYNFKTKEQYYKELKSPKWFAKREIILKLDDYKCRHCGATENLIVHHKQYIGNRKAWEYPNELLMTLCKDCHKKVHYLD